MSATTDAALHDAFAALQPFINAADASSPGASWRGVTAKVTTGDPLTVDVRCEGENGQTRIFRAIGWGDIGDTIAHAAGALLACGIDELPLATRRHVAAQAEAGSTFALVVDPLFQTAEVWIVTADRCELQLTTLTTGDVH